jgi:hypothetical protein
MPPRSGASKRMAQPLPRPTSRPAPPGAIPLFHSPTTNRSMLDTVRCFSRPNRIVRWALLSLISRTIGTVSAMLLWRFP